MGQRRTLKEIYRELVSSPFFPLLFIGKGVETAGFAVIGSATWEEAALMMSYGVVATIWWAASDSVEFDAESFVGE